MEFITDKGSKIHLVDLPHNVVYNEVDTRPQHRRRRVDDTDYMNLKLNDDDWVHHILRCNNINYKPPILLTQQLRCNARCWKPDSNGLLVSYKDGNWIYGQQCSHFKYGTSPICLFHKKIQKVNCHFQAKSLKN